MKRLTYLAVAIAFLIGVAITFDACKKEEKTPDDEIIIPETTKVIDNKTWNDNIVSIDTSNYQFIFKDDINSSIEIKPGDIIVSQEGYGYLRKVTNIQNEGDNIKVYTSFASLSEAIENGSFSFETVLSEQKIMRIDYQKEGVVLDTSNMKSTEQTALNYDIDTYLDNNNTVHLQGSFVLLPSVNAELIIKWFKVKKLEVEFVVDEQINLENTIELVNIAYEKEMKLAAVVFHPIIVMLGPVPVVIVPELEIFAGVELDVESTVTTTVDQSLSYNAGLLYENSKWSTYKEINKQLNYLPPSLTATAEAKAYIKPQMNLKFYGTVAPYLAGELYGRIDAELQTNPWWSLYGGVSIGAGIEMEIFGEELFDYYTDPPIIEYEVLIIDANTVGDNQAPVLPTNPIPSNNANEQSVNVDITWECSDPDEDPLAYDIYFGESTNPELVLSNSSNTTYDPGTLNENTTYYWKIAAKDDHDHTTYGSVWQFTTTDGSNNQAPDLPSKPVPVNQATDISLSTLLEWECSDPENDPLTFDIYFGTNNPPAIAETNQSSFSYNPGTLSQSTQYYWKIVAKDDQGNQTEGVIWIFTTTDGGSTSTFTDPRDSQTYNIVTIGSQTWMAENLNYETADSWCYDNNSSNCNEYGRLYTWDAAMDGEASSNEVPSGVQGICPPDWHLPSDNEWKVLEMHLGMSQDEADAIGWRGTDEGGKMKETGTAHWNSPNTGATNSSGFTALPVGSRYSNGLFSNPGLLGRWWSSSESSGRNTWYRDLLYDNDQVHRFNLSKMHGFSVRCLKN